MAVTVVAPLHSWHTVSVLAALLCVVQSNTIDIGASLIKTSNIRFDDLFDDLELFLSCCEPLADCILSVGISLFFVARLRRGFNKAQAVPKGKGCSVQLEEDVFGKRKADQLGKAEFVSSFPSPASRKVYTQKQPNDVAAIDGGSPPWTHSSDSKGGHRPFLLERALAVSHTRTSAGAVRCRILIGIDPYDEFKVVRRMIGKGGKNMKDILEEVPDAKIRIRGRGSGFYEGPEKIEADEPLMVCVRASSPATFQTTLSRVEELLERVHNDYCKFCRCRNKPEQEIVSGVQY